MKLIKLKKLLLIVIQGSYSQGTTQISGSTCFSNWAQSLSSNEYMYNQCGSVYSRRHFINGQPIVIIIIVCSIAIACYCCIILRSMASMERQTKANTGRSRAIRRTMWRCVVIVRLLTDCLFACLFVCLLDWLIDWAHGLLVYQSISKRMSIVGFANCFELVKRTEPKWLSASAATSDAASDSTAACCPGDYKVFAETYLARNACCSMKCVAVSQLKQIW